MKLRIRKHGISGMERAVHALSFTLLLGLANGSQAFQIDTDNSDVAIRWDNTLRYNIGQRMEKRDSRIIGNPLTDESDYKFDKGDLVTNRIDLLSEFDFVYQKRLGFRVSGAAWYDDAYKHATSVRNPSLVTPVTPSSYQNGQYSLYTARWYKQGGEILDAFVFANLDLGGTPLNLKAGQHTIYWGQSVFYSGGIAYSQSPIDAVKATSSPGTELKELFLPLNQFSFQTQITQELSVMGQYFFDWKPYRTPEGGTYLSAMDFTVSGPNGWALPGVFIPPATVVTPGLFQREDPLVPDKKHGNWGIGAKWLPESLHGASLAAYYREFDEKVPWLFADPNVGFPFAYRTVYPRKTKLIGVASDFQLGPTLIGAELSYRRNTALQTPAFSFLNEDGGARGDTWHAVANATYLMPTTPLWEAGVLLAELHYSRLDKVTKNEAVFQGVGRAACTNPLTAVGGAPAVPGSGNKEDGCATKDAWGIDVMFMPQWPQAFAGVDLSLPITANYQIKGNDAAMGGGSNEGAYSYSIGLEALIFQKVSAKLAYNDYGGKISRMAGGVWGNINGSINPNALLQDRGWLSLTVKASF